ncbi:hypothetical protein KNU02_gp21 [Gordonia phage Pleakley]|uniref:Uncharacterized protein n=1 Tax=Gordonia phage Pleakley TaxID=2283246 RepID=A0A345M6D9_9CAUD|nr:hypothetical protein KNU02_gp21 [Gordonia phage Pleakley]AXH49747.1 hypothetical protein SEA_FURY_21 [Gordonia phage Fury]AXH66060.1 hypothetical protein SEA_PLEAKLEY_21 [Gordonia phage Pleakley]
MENAVTELKVTKRIDADRVGRVLKQNRDTMREMEPEKLQSLIRQAEADMKRCADASNVTRNIATQLADVMLMGIEVAEARRIRIP